MGIGLKGAQEQPCTFEMSFALGVLLTLNQVDTDVQLQLSFHGTFH